MGVSWDSDPNDFLDVVIKSHKEICERVAIQVYAEIVARTPVYSGNLRASWNISHTDPNYVVKTEGTHNIPLEAPSIPVTIDGLPDFPEIHISNGLPYVTYVNDGSPKNVPVHMVELALESIKD